MAWTKWETFAAKAPELAAFGAERLRGGPSYLATVRGDALPRVHPVSTIVSERRLLVFMFPTSPKGHDLREDGRYAVHTAVADSAGTGGEFLARGRARLVDDPAVRAEAADAGYPPRDEYILFELGVEAALATEYVDGTPRHRRWSATSD